MPKTHAARVDVNETALDRRLQRVRRASDSAGSGCRENLAEHPSLVSCGNEEDAPCLAWHFGCASRICSLEALGQRQHGRESRASDLLLRRQGVWQLDERERVADGLAEQP